MRKYAALILALGLMHNAVAAVSPSIDKRSVIIEFLDIGDYKAAAPLIDEYLVKKPKDGEMHFLAARVYAQLNQPEYADQHLLVALKNGFQDFSAMSRHPDLKPIRQKGIYQVIMRARDAADDILATRRVKEWLKQFNNPSYQHLHTEGSKYDFITSLSREDFKLIEERIETLGDSIASTIFGEDLKHRILIAFPVDVDKPKLLSTKNTKGRYRHSRCELIATDAGMTLQHELVHAFHHNHMDMLGQEHPIWIQEGIASLFESIDISEDGTVHFFANDRHYVAHNLAQNKNLITLHTLFNMTAATFNENPAKHYALTRSLFEYIAETDLLSEWYDLYINEYETDPTGIFALESVFEQSVNEIEEAWKYWLLSRTPEFKNDTGGSIIVTAARRFESKIEVNPIEVEIVVSEEEVRKAKASELYKAAKPRLLSDYSKAVKPLLKVIALNPDHAAARYDLGLAYISTGKVELAKEQVVILRSLDRNLYNMLGNLCRKH